MSRIRSIHPGQWTDEDFVECSAFARLLALGIRNECDDNGCFAWKPKTIKMKIFPADDIDVEALLMELVQNNQVIKYEVDGTSYGMVRHFCRFQSPKKPNFFFPVPNQFPTGYELHKDYKVENSRPVPNQFPTGSPPVEKNESRREEEEEEEEEYNNTLSPQVRPREKIPIQNLTVEHFNEFMLQREMAGRPITIDVETELAKFKAHFLASGGKTKHNTPVEDWGERFKKWLLDGQQTHENNQAKEKRDEQNRTVRGRKNIVEQQIESAARVIGGGREPGMG